jgi:hypothetical protein
MKRLILLALVALALTAVPVALGDDGGSTPPAAGQAPAGQQAGSGGRLAMLRMRLQLVEMRFAKHCSNGADQQRCVAFAQKVEQRLQTLDGNVQKKIQANCASGSADQRCTVLTQLDTRLQALIQKVQDWLSGKGSSSSSSSTSSSSSSDSSLDQAAAGLGQLKP